MPVLHRLVGISGPRLLRPTSSDSALLLRAGRQARSSETMNRYLVPSAGSFIAGWGQTGRPEGGWKGGEREIETLVAGAFDPFGERFAVETCFGATGLNPSR